MPPRLSQYLPTTVTSKLPFGSLTNERRAGGGGGWELLQQSDSSTNALPRYQDNDDDDDDIMIGGERRKSKSKKSYQRHHRQISLSTFGRSIRRIIQLCLVLLVSGLTLFVLARVVGRSSSFGGSGKYGNDGDDGGTGPVPLGQSRMRNGREVFWWEGFEDLRGFFVGRNDVVLKKDWRSEQDFLNRLKNDSNNNDSGKQNRNDRGNEVRTIGDDNGVGLRILDVNNVNNHGRVDEERILCYIDEKKGILPPTLSVYNGIPQGFPAPLFGSSDVIGFQENACYDRINRFGPYGYGFKEAIGGFGIQSQGDNEGQDGVNSTDFRGVRWFDAQRKCLAKTRNQSRTVFMIRTWSTFEYTPWHIMMLRAIVSELTLASGGRYEVHFLIQVQNDSIPIWASQEVYNQTLKESLPEEFAGMGTLWSVAQMKLVYPPPFPESIVNFSGDDIYKAYRSLHFPLQYFASQHSEYDYYWEWEMDLRVTGHYLELLDRITEWANKQPRKNAWERSAKFFIPALFDGDDDQTRYAAYSRSVDDEIKASGKSPISGPQLPLADLLSPPPGVSYDSDDEITDLITLNPLFDPNGTRWAFRDDITGYNRSQRPPTRTALITASRLSRRLLITMHEETFRNKHTMFPETYPASIALHYGYKAIYAPVPIYMDRNWPSPHADLVYNNAPIPPGSPEDLDGMNHANGHFQGDPGSVFGPGEHVFRGASYYSNAGFAGYLWRRWLGRENGFGEIGWELDKPETEEERRKGRGSGRMCLPMVVLHPIKFE